MTVKINENGKWCTKCKKFLPFEAFNRIRSSTPYASQCKECVKKWVDKRRKEIFW